MRRVPLNIERRAAATARNRLSVPEAVSKHKGFFAAITEALKPPFSVSRYCRADYCELAELLPDLEGFMHIPLYPDRHFFFEAKPLRTI
jgi:hypothetical protein